MIPISAITIHRSTIHRITNLASQLDYVLGGLQSPPVIEGRLRSQTADEFLRGLDVVCERGTERFLPFLEAKPCNSSLKVICIGRPALIGVFGEIKL